VHVTIDETKSLLAIWTKLTMDGSKKQFNRIQGGIEFLDRDDRRRNNLHGNRKVKMSQPLMPVVTAAAARAEHFRELGRILLPLLGVRHLPPRRFE
jgi:hypothetical protein